MKTLILKKFGKNVKKIRVSKALSQEQLAEITNLHRTYIGSIERGERNVSLQNIVIIAKSLECKITDLFQGITK